MKIIIKNSVFKKTVFSIHEDRVAEKYYAFYDKLYYHQNLPVEIVSKVKKKKALLPPPLYLQLLDDSLLICIIAKLQVAQRRF